MNSCICKTIGEIEEDNSSSIILSNYSFNNKLFQEPFCNEKNKLLILCILSKIVYKHSEKEYICYITKKWNIKYKIEQLNGIIYGLFYTDDFLVISFKGTSSFKETLSNLKFIQTDDKYSIPGYIHKGFHDLILTNNVVETLEDKIYIGNHKNIYITGHSLGGALATIFYSYLISSPLSNKSKDKNIELVTYGCPRTGDKEFSKTIENSTRIVNGNDIVTKIPIIDYKHSEKLHHIGSKWSCRLISDHHISNYYEKLNLINNNS